MYQENSASSKRKKFNYFKLDDIFNLDQPATFFERSQPNILARAYYTPFHQTSSDDPPFIKPIIKPPSNSTSNSTKTPTPLQLFFYGKSYKPRGFKSLPTTEPTANSESLGSKPVIPPLAKNDKRKFKSWSIHRTFGPPPKYRPKNDPNKVSRGREAIKVLDRDDFRIAFNAESDLKIPPHHPFFRRRHKKKKNDQIQSLSIRGAISYHEKFTTVSNNEAKCLTKQPAGIEGIFTFPTNALIDFPFGSGFKIMECPLCLTQFNLDASPYAIKKLQNCEHGFCRDCLYRYFEIEINDGRINLACPRCTERVHPSDVTEIFLNKFPEENAEGMAIVEDPPNNIISASNDITATTDSIQNEVLENELDTHHNQEATTSNSCPTPKPPDEDNVPGADLIRKYETFTLRRFLVSEPDARWCPAPDCGFAVIASGCASCPMLKCERPGCNTYFCYHCKNEWHPNLTCDAAKAIRFHRQRNNNYYCPPDSDKLSAAAANLPSTSTAILAPGSICGSPTLEFLNFNGLGLGSETNIKLCPRCQACIMKMDDGSCNHMTCAICGSEFCWLCMKEISDLHYLSPSGCTFWGKKPWSRKKKILWQLGTLVGAPVGIALIASIAIPAIIIGVPIFVGRKIYTKYKKTKSINRNSLIGIAVMTSVILSPMLAFVAVTVGVPILLAYVYGVVPFSLCRNGLCGNINNIPGTTNSASLPPLLPSQAQPPPQPSITSNFSTEVGISDVKEELQDGGGGSVPTADVDEKFTVKPGSIDPFKIRDSLTMLSLAASAAAAAAAVPTTSRRASLLRDLAFAPGSGDHDLAHDPRVREALYYEYEHETAASSRASRRRLRRLQSRRRQTGTNDDDNTSAFSLFLNRYRLLGSSARRTTLHPQTAPIPTTTTTPLSHTGESGVGGSGCRGGRSTSSIFASFVSRFRKRPSNPTSAFSVPLNGKDHAMNQNRVAQSYPDTVTTIENQDILSPLLNETAHGEMKKEMIDVKFPKFPIEVTMLPVKSGRSESLKEIRLLKHCTVCENNTFSTSGVPGLLKYISYSFEMPQPSTTYITSTIFPGQKYSSSSNQQSPTTTAHLKTSLSNTDLKRRKTVITIVKNLDTCVKKSAVSSVSLPTKTCFQNADALSSPPTTACCPSYITKTTPDSVIESSEVPNVQSSPSPFFSTSATAISQPYTAAITLLKQATSSSAYVSEPSAFYLSQKKQTITTTSATNNNIHSTTINNKLSSRKTTTAQVSAPFTSPPLLSCPPSTTTTTSKETTDKKKTKNNSQLHHQNNAFTNWINRIMNSYAPFLNGHNSLTATTQQQQLPSSCYFSSNNNGGFGGANNNNNNLNNNLIQNNSHKTAAIASTTTTVSSNRKTVPSKTVSSLLNTALVVNKRNQSVSSSKRKLLPKTRDRIEDDAEILATKNEDDSNSCFITRLSHLPPITRAVNDTTTSLNDRIPNKSPVSFDFMDEAIADLKNDLKTLDELRAGDDGGTGTGVGNPSIASTCPSFRLLRNNNNNNFSCPTSPSKKRSSSLTKGCGEGDEDLGTEPSIDVSIGTCSEMLLGSGVTNYLLLPVVLYPSTAISSGSGVGGNHSPSNYHQEEREPSYNLDVSAANLSDSVGGYYGEMDTSHDTFPSAHITPKQICCPINYTSSSSKMAPQLVCTAGGDNVICNNNVTQSPKNNQVSTPTLLGNPVINDIHIPNPIITNTNNHRNFTTDPSKPHEKDQLSQQPTCPFKRTYDETEEDECSSTKSGGKSSSLLTAITDDGASSTRALAGSIAYNREMDEASLKALAGSIVNGPTHHETFLLDSKMNDCPNKECSSNSNNNKVSATIKIYNMDKPYYPKDSNNESTTKTAAAADDKDKTLTPQNFENFKFLSSSKSLRRNLKKSFMDASSSS